MGVNAVIKGLRCGICWNLAGLVMCWSVTVLAEQGTENAKEVAGWLETIVIVPWGFKLRAKLDTGAKTSSIHANEIERFERDGEPWVRFVTRDRRANDGERFTIERPLLKTVKIKRHARSPKIRLVVELDFCLGQRLYKSEFTLTNRAGFNYPVLLGRRMLEEDIIVDPALLFTRKTARKSCISKVKSPSFAAKEKTSAMQLQ